MDLTVRRAREDDADAVAALTRDTWPVRDVDDYLADVFDEWVASDGADQRTLVAEIDGDVAGVIQGVLLSDYEAWAQGLRVAPARRGEGVGRRLTEATFAWARTAGASVVRNLVFSWNAPSLGLSRRAGFEPRAAFRWARPDPDAGADPTLDVTADADAGWTFWSGSEARSRLCGLALHGEQSWALSELTRDRLGAAAEADRLLTVRDGGVRALSLRNRLAERDGETLAEYAVGAWADAAAAESLFAAVAADAAAVGADRTRVLIPERVDWVTDAAAARVDLSDGPDFVLAADLTGADAEA